MIRCKYNDFVSCNVKDCNNCEIYKVYQQGRQDMYNELQNTEIRERVMFAKIRKMLDKYEELLAKEVIDESDGEWLDDYEFNMAKALNKELPACLKIAKLLCIMRDNEIKIQLK